MSFEIILITAVAQNNVIGYNDKIPWHLPADLSRFKQLTLNYPVLMGRKTYDSILTKLGKPLPERLNLVLTRKLSLSSNLTNVFYYNSFNEVISDLKNGKISAPKVNFSKLWVIGGQEIYQLALPLAHRIELTLINRSYQGDKFFPNLDDQWQIINRYNMEEYSFITYIKKENIL